MHSKKTRLTLNDRSPELKSGARRRHPEMQLKLKLYNNL